jgi:hypothetical protein
MFRTITIALALCAGESEAAWSTPVQDKLQSPGAISISHNRILRDGRPWVPHAVQLVAFVAPPKAQAGAFRRAYEHYNPSEFAAIKAWGADSVRLQLSQPGADPDPGRGDPDFGMYDPDFVKKYIDAVHAARAAGLNVIVSIQDEPQSGERKKPTRLPNDATIRVWKSILPDLKDDPGILYEMFNEPQLKPNAANWSKWAAAMNKVIATIRASGATNTLVADGLSFAETLDGVVPLDDPKVIYSSHPYFHHGVDQDETTWMRKFGAAATKMPVVVGEWTSATTYYCDSATTPAAALEMLKYLDLRKIGLVAVTYDFGLPKYGGIVSDYSGTPTTFANHVGCGEVGFGPGTLIQRWYRTGALPGALQ